MLLTYLTFSLRWRYDGCVGVSNHQPLDCLLNHLFRRRSKKLSKLHATGLCAWNSPVTGEFPKQMASNAENVSIWWRHHVEVIQHPGAFPQQGTTLLRTHIVFTVKYPGVHVNEIEWICTVFYYKMVNSSGAETGVVQEPNKMLSFFLYQI